MSYFSKCGYECICLFRNVIDVVFGESFRSILTPENFMRCSGAIWFRVVQENDLSTDVLLSIINFALETFR
jgi:hypothetical protein